MSSETKKIFCLPKESQCRGIYTVADIQEVVASLKLDKKCLSLFPWKEGGEPDTSTSFPQLFFKPVLDISDMEGYLLYFCFIQASGKI